MNAYPDDEYELVSRRVRVVDEKGEAKFIELT